MEPMEIAEREETRARPGRVGRLRRTLAVLVVATVGGTFVLQAAPAWAVTRGVKAVRTDNGWRWRDVRTGALKHTYIARGDYVRWRNPTARTHNIRAYGGNWSYSRTISPGQSVRRRFTSTGTYRYRCTLHSSLNGTRCRGQCGIIHV
ncbi:MAG: cupredoxin domain-containing protein [Actinomycetota bacterium]